MIWFIEKAQRGVLLIWINGKYRKNPENKLQLVMRGQMEKSQLFCFFVFYQNNSQQLLYTSLY